MVNIAFRAIVFCAALVFLLPFPSGRTLGAPIDPVQAPSFWDPDLRLEKPDLTGIRAIRFLTSDDYPPLNFALGDGTLTGFNVEIARAVCAELEIACTIQARRWDTLIDSLVTGKGDAVVASIAATPDNRDRIDFSQPYYETPARFVVRKDAELRPPPPQAGLEARQSASSADRRTRPISKRFSRARSRRPIRASRRWRRLCAGAKSASPSPTA